jgi:hypothetical protein
MIQANEIGPETLLLALEGFFWKLLPDDQPIAFSCQPNAQQLHENIHNRSAHNLPVSIQFDSS